MTAQGKAEWWRRPWPRCLIAAAGLVAALAAAPAAPAAVPAAPAWAIAVSSYPTNLVPGSSGTPGGAPGYLVVATNVGGAPTSGTFELTDTLPPGLEFSSATGARGSYGANHTKLDCEIAGDAVACRGGAPTLKPGELVTVNIAVRVSSTAPETVLDTASVEGGGAAMATATVDTPVTPQLPSFSILSRLGGGGGPITLADGSAATQAGSHPYEVRTAVGFPTMTYGSSNSVLSVAGGAKDLSIELPPGLVVNPSATPTRCTEAELEEAQIGCPEGSQVGILTLSFSFGEGMGASPIPLYNMVAPGGSALELGAEVTEGLIVHVSGGLRSDGDYGLSASVDNIPAKLPVGGAEVTLWGNPTDPSHDYVRGSCLASGSTCPVERSGAAFLTLPSACGGPLRTVARADSWIEPGKSVEMESTSPAIDGCGRLDFEPTITSQPTTSLVDSPSGLDLGIHLPQYDDFAGLAEANLKDATVTLPEGVAINPAAADGLAACSPAEIGLLTPVGQSAGRFNAAPAACPDGAKIGTVELDTPLIDHPLAGAIYVAEPFENPYGSRLAVYLAIDDPQSGIAAKLDARVDADPVSGRLTVSLAGLPQLPIEKLEARFFAGPRALLRTPIGCGSYSTRADLTPWSTPEGVDAARSDAFIIGAAPGGASGCPSGEAEAANRPGFSAGTAAPRAGAYSPFVLRLNREDGSQRLAALDTTLPAGLAGRLTGVPRCPDAQLAAASCPAAAELGTVDIGAGAGPVPLHLGGHVYLAGPYKGAPLSLAIVTPAVAGPFDLGTVVVRVALYVDKRSARIHAVSDPLPTILQGVPLDVRSLALDLDRPSFTRNPTSCDPMSVAAIATSAAGQSVPLSSPFQVGNCSRLGFKPRVSVRFLGPTHRGAHPSFRTTLRARGGDANIRRVAVTLPGTELLDNRNIKSVCTVAQFSIDDCPPSSVYGYARAWSPLLDRPLKGPVYLRSSSHRLPDLAASLGGQVDLDLIGHVASVRGRLRDTFAALPDVPLTKVVLTMRGGKRGLLVNSTELCRARPRAATEFVGQNGKTSGSNPVVKTECEKGGRQ